VIDEDREEEEEEEEREIRPINLSRAAAHLSQVPVLEFWNNLWGLGTDYRPAIGWRNRFLSFLKV
jgi:hypothetical protein